MATRILVVDDEPAVGRMMQTVLNTLGVEAEFIADSRKAAERLCSEKFEAVFLDAKMPTPSGLELVREIRSGGFNQNTPLVMITGDTDTAMLSKAFQAGTNYFLFKPLDTQKLRRVIRASHGAVEREKRRYRRVAVVRAVTVESEGRKIEGQTADLSLGGVLIRAEGPMPEGAHVGMEFRLSPGNRPLKARGRIVRKANDLMGIQFDYLDAVETERLQEFLLPFILAESGNTKS